MHIGVLHRYLNSVSNRIPDRLRQIILTSGTQLIENAVVLGWLLTKDFRRVCDLTRFGNMRGFKVSPTCSLSREAITTLIE